MRPPRVTQKRIAAAAVAALLCLPLAACSGGLAGGSAGDSTVEAMPHDGAALDSAAGGASEASPESSATVEAGRSIISNGGITIEVGDTDEAVETVRGIASELDGYVESQTVSSSGTGGATLTLRVPSTRFEDAFASLSKVGKVLDESRSATDVTAEHVDLQARVKSLQTSIDRLADLMAGATTTSELIEAESALTARQAELDSLKAQLESLEGQVDEATIWVSLTTESVLPGGPSNFWEGLLAGLQSLGTAGAGALVLLGVLLPWLVIAGAIALVVVLLVRRSRRRRRASAAAEPVQAPPQAPTHAPVPEQFPAQASAEAPPAPQPPTTPVG